MKILCAAFVWNLFHCTLLLSNGSAFVPSRQRLPCRPEYSERISLSQPSSSTSTRQFAVSVQEKNSVVQDVDSGAIWEQLGIAEGKLALGVKPEEVLKYIGTREDLITKTMIDLPSFSREKAEVEVDKFLMDCEMVNLYIQFGKEVEKNPDFVVPDTPEENGLFSVRNIVFGYLAYVTATSIPQIIRRVVAEQEVAGTWKPTNVVFFDEWIDKTSAEATARVLQKAAEKAASAASAAPDSTISSAVIDSAQTVVDAVANSDPSVVVPSALLDSVQSVVDVASIATA